MLFIKTKHLPKSAKMDLQKRALYNSLRMNWLLDPTLQVASWQVENYREMSLPLILGYLEKYQLNFTKESFSVFAEEFDSPEELADELLSELNLTPEDEDRAYLLIFELWRRIETDKPCLSVFCDELDHQIFLYDRRQTQNTEDIEDAISNLQVILNQNTDGGGDPIEILKSVNKGCANDIETFLYDFTNEQIENLNYSYATELIDSFIEFVSDTKWFDLLQVRILQNMDREGADTLMQQLFEEAQSDEDLQFNLELLYEIIQKDDPETFLQLLDNTAGLLEVEEDFLDFLVICIDYCSRNDREKEEKILRTIGESRNHDLSAPLKKNDPDLLILLNTVR